MKLWRSIGPIWLSLTACAAGAGDSGADPAATVQYENLLVIGDSISLGQGALGTSPDCKLSSEYNSAEASYGAKVAAQTGAEMELWAWSGHGLVRNYGEFKGPTIWSRVQNKLRKGAASDIDLVLVNVGTNDFSRSDPGASFVATYQELLARLTSSFPKARILVMSGPMLSGADRENLNAAVAKAVQAYRLAKPQSAVEYLKITDKVWQAGPRGCQYHPSEPVHAAMATAILERLAQ